MKKTIISVSVFATLLSFAQDTSVQESEGLAEFNIGSTFSNPVTKILGDNKATKIWKDSAPDNRYFYTPAILPEWERYIEKVEQNCSEGKNDGILQLPLRVVLNNKIYKDELVETINNKLRNSAKNSESKSQTLPITDPESQLFTIPYQIFRIVLQLDGESKMVLYDSLAAEVASIENEQYQTTQKTSLPRIKQVKVIGSCSFHNNILDAISEGQENLIVGELYRTGAVYDKTVLDYVSVFSALDNLNSKIFSDEKVTFNASTKGRGAGLGINIPLLKGGFGKSQTSSEVKTEGLRVVNRQFIQNALEEIMQSSSLTCDGTKCDKLLKTISNHIFDQTVGQAYLSRNSENGSYELVAKQIGYVTPIKDNGVKTKLDSIFYTKNKDESTEEAGIGEKGLSAEKSQTTENEVKQTSNASLDNVPLANRVDLQIISKNSFKQAKSYSISLREPISGKTQKTYFTLIYPELGYDENGIFLPLEKVKKDLERKRKNAAFAKKCREKRFTKKKEDSIARLFRGSTGNGVTGLTDLLTVSADPDYYIPNNTENWEITATSSHNKSIQNTAYNPLEGSETINGEVLQLNSVSAKFRCRRGEKPLSRRKCTASGTIIIWQEPLKCAEYLIK